MSTFRFRLAPVLRLREAARQERRAALAEAYRVDDLLRGQIESVAAEMERLRNVSRQAGGPGPVNVDRLVETQRYQAALGNQRGQVLRQRETVTVEIERRQQALLAADRDVRVLEKLRQRQAERFRLEEDRREMKRLDEAAQQQFMREAVR